MPRIIRNAFGRIVLWIGWENCRAKPLDRYVNGGTMTSIALQRTPHKPGHDPSVLRSPTSKVGKTRYDD